MSRSSLARPCSLLAAAALLPLAAATAAAQGAAPAAAPGPVLPAEQQVAAAVLALPEGLRAGAAVLGYSPQRALVPLRAGSNGMICLADDPSEPRFHVACYHESLEQFMARGRALRASGVQGPQVDTVRFAEVRDGKLRMPTQPAALYSLTDPNGGYDAARNAAPAARGLFVLYTPGATEQSTGLSAQPSRTLPWVMFPGTPKAHIMFTLSM